MLSDGEGGNRQLSGKLLGPSRKGLVNTVRIKRHKPGKTDFLNYQNVFSVPFLRLLPHTYLLTLDGSSITQGMRK